VNAWADPEGPHGSTVAERAVSGVPLEPTEVEPRNRVTIIPIYEYSCQDCGHEFEALVRGGETPACPECESRSLERAFSLPAVRSSGTHDLAMRAARKRDERQGQERMHAQREYELNHDDH
jgi:putative FmdB family regulatory protein